MAKAVAAAIVAGLMACAPAYAQTKISDGVVRIGILNDQSGPYSDFQGHGSVVAAKLAIEDFGRTVHGARVELVVGDHQNKADVGAGIARRWIGADGVDAIFDIGNSAVSLAVQEINRGNTVMMHVGSGSDALYGSHCSKTGFLWVYDTTAIARALGQSLATSGGDSWFYIAVDYAFGPAMAAVLTPVIKRAGGSVVGSVKHPINSQDFSSYLLQAQASGAKVIALLNAGDDTTNAIKQAAEFGITKGGQKIAGTTFYIPTVDSLGLEAAQGLQVVTAFYWDRNEETRRFTERWKTAMGKDRVPTQIQAGVYSAVLAYLRAVEASGTDAAGAVSDKLRTLPVNDFFAEGARVREDGRLMKDLFLARVKSPAESRGRWDYYDVKMKVSADDIIRPLSEGGCQYVMNK